MNFFYGFALSTITIAVGRVAYILTLTTNDTAIGGYLLFGFFTLAPILFFVLGRFAVFESDRYTDFGETYFRKGKKNTYRTATG